MKKSKIDVILMSPKLYSLFTGELDALNPHSQEGYVREYMFNGIPFYGAKIPEYTIRFVSPDKVFTRRFLPEDATIFSDLRAMLKGCEAE